MEGIRSIKKPRLKSPYLIVAWPGMGEVAFKAASYLVEKLKAEDLAEIPAEEFFYLTASVVKNGILSVPELPQSKFYFWKNKTGKNDLIIFLSNAQPDLIQAEGYCRRIISVAKHYRVKNIVGLAAMPQPIEHTQPVNIWVATTTQELQTELKKYNLTPMEDGQISGMNGLFLGVAKREGFAGFCLLGEIPLYTIQVENPKAAAAVLEALARILGIKIELTELQEQAQTMEAEINKLLEYLKVGGAKPWAHQRRRYRKDKKRP